MNTYSPYHQKVFDDRGIPLWLADARPYREWTPENQEPLRQDFDYYVDKKLQPHQKAHLTKIANQTPGLVIVRHTPERIKETADQPYRIYPELRPDVLVRTKGPQRHWHGDEILIGWESKTGLVKVDDYERSVQRVTDPDHIAKAVADNPDPERFPDFINGLRVYYGGHGGEHTNEVHYHQDLPKYVFECNPLIEVWHDHQEFKDKGKSKRRARWELNSHLRQPNRQGHIVKCTTKHRGVPEGRHPHKPKIENVKGRHSHWVPDDEHGWAQRLDVHPLTEKLGLFDKAEVVFFGIEGCLKADAILSAGEAVFSVPAVWLFQAPELRDFAAKYLQDKLVVIVPDADWRTKQSKNVIQAASACLATLQSLGLQAVIAAPPRNSDGTFTWKGIDDFLAGGGKLEDLDVVSYDLDEVQIGLVGAHLQDKPGGLRFDAVANAVLVLRYLAIMSADKHGKGRVNLRKAGQAGLWLLDLDHHTVAAAMARLYAAGILTEWQRDIGHGKWNAGRTLDTGRYQIAEWARVQERHPESLGDELVWLGRSLTKAKIEDPKSEKLTGV